MTHQLTGLGSRRRKPHAIDHAVETALKKHQQVLASDALDPFRLFEVGTELTLQKAIGTLDTLFFTQLRTVVGNLA